MAVTILDDYPPFTRNGNSCSACSAGRRELRDPDGTLRQERVVDFGIQVDMEGHLMFCEQCILEAARILGLVDAGDRDEALVRATVLEADNARLRTERDEAKQLVALILDYRDREDATTFVGVPEPAMVTQPEPELVGNGEAVHNADLNGNATSGPAPARKTTTRKAKATA